MRRASREWLFRWRFAQSRVAQPGLVPTLAVFASRSAISTPPRFAINYSVRATLAVFAETHRLRTSDVERDQEGSRKPSLRCYTGITYSIKSVGQNKSFAPVHSAARSVDCAGSELVVLVLEQDVDRGERSVTARDILLQAFARFFGTGQRRTNIQHSGGGARPKAGETQPSCDERQRLPAW